jgi:hypothetical protein
MKFCHEFFVMEFFHGVFTWSFFMEFFHGVTGDSLFLFFASSRTLGGVSTHAN